MDHESIKKIKRYYHHIKNYRETAINESKKTSIKLFYDAVEDYFTRNPIPRDLESIKCRTFYRLYSKIEPFLIDCNSEEKLIKFFERIEKIITNPRFRVSLLERTIKSIFY